MVDFPGVFSSGVTPLHIPGVNLRRSRTLGLIGAHSPEFGDRPVYFLNAIFPDDVEAVQRAGSMTGESAKCLEDKTHELHRKILSDTCNVFPCATRSLFGVKKREELEKVSNDRMDKTFNHSEQSLLSVLGRTNWVAKTVDTFLQKNPHLQVAGLIGFVGTKRDACSSCARRLSLLSRSVFEVLHGRRWESIPFTVAVSGFAQFVQHALVEVGGESKFASGKYHSRSPEIGAVVHDSLDLAAHKFVTHMG